MHQRATDAANAGLADEATLNRMSPETSRSIIKQNLVRLSIGSEFVKEALNVGGDLLEAREFIEPRQSTELEKGNEEDVSSSPVSSEASWLACVKEYISPTVSRTNSRAVSPETTRRQFKTAEL